MRSLTRGRRDRRRTRPRASGRAAAEAAARPGAGLLALPSLPPERPARQGRLDPRARAELALPPEVPGRQWQLDLLAAPPFPCAVLTINGGPGGRRSPLPATRPQEPA